MIHRPRSRRRSGYALLIVLGFEMLLLAVWGVAYRSVGSAYRVELVRSLRRNRDEGTMTMLGYGMALLQTGVPRHQTGNLPFTVGETYTCYDQINTTVGERWYILEFTCVLPVPPLPPLPGTPTISQWTVRAFVLTDSAVIANVVANGGANRPASFATAPVP